MKRSSGSCIRENLTLMGAANRALNGANIHKGRALIATYQNAIEVASAVRRDRKRLPDALGFLAKVETALADFAYRGRL